MNFNKNLKTFQKFLSSNGVDFALVFSNDEFLKECSDLNSNARYLLSGFTGTAGDMLVSPQEAFLFVDGRYHIQVDEQTDKNLITPIKLKMGERRNEKIAEIIKEKKVKNPKIALASSKISAKSFEILRADLKSVQPKYILADEDEVCKKFEIKNKKNVYKVWQAGIKQVGKSTAQKLKGLKKYESDCLLVFANDEVCYLGNIRSDQNPYSSSLSAFALIGGGIVQLFCDKNNIPKSLLDISKEVVFRDFSEFEKSVKNIKSTIFYDANQTPLLYVKKLERAKKTIKILDKSPIAKMKSQKNKTELAYISECYRKSDIALNQAINFLQEKILNKEKITCGDFMEKLLKLQKAQGVIGLSFTPIFALNERSAIIHCTEYDKNVVIKDGDLILLDFGVYFEGGYATDMTRTFAVGKKYGNELMKKVYTSVLKAFLNTLNYPITKETKFFDLDKKARDIIKRAKMPDFNFNHGTGHGIGLNVHEMPPTLSPSKLAQKKLKANMVFSIEPGMYKEGVGGVRLENSVCTIKTPKGIEIKTLTNLPFDEKLIILDMLTKKEKKWLSDYQAGVVK
ncbi:MAG: M24 family metallopeptidase [bacterium]|nr:M24 family metallopeptidase [bacterium]